MRIEGEEEEEMEFLIESLWNLVGRRRRRNQLLISDVPCIAMLQLPSVPLRQFPDAVFLLLLQADAQ